MRAAQKAAKAYRFNDQKSGLKQMAGGPNAKPLSTKETGRAKKIGQLKKADEISSVFDFKCRISSVHFIALAKPNQREKPRLVVMVGKKTHRLAVCRNYMRRVCQEFCRIEQASLDSMDIVIRVIKPFVKQDFCQITQEIENLIAGLGKCRDS